MKKIKNIIGLGAIVALFSFNLYYAYGGYGHTIKGLISSAFATETETTGCGTDPTTGKKNKCDQIKSSKKESVVCPDGKTRTYFDSKGDVICVENYNYQGYATVRVYHNGYSSLGGSVRSSDTYFTTTLDSEKVTCSSGGSEACIDKFETDCSVLRSQGATAS